MNQIEALNTLVDSRLVVERNKVLYRSPQTIRGSLLAKLGIPPSPLLTLGPKGRYTDIANMSGPGMERRISESWDKIKNKNPSFIKSSPKTIRNASNNGNNSSNGSRQMSSSYSGATKPMSSDINSYQNEQNDEGVALV